MSNTLDIKRYYKPIETKLKKHEMNIENCDIVISGLGFIKCIGTGQINIYTHEKIEVYKRECLI